MKELISAWIVMVMAVLFLTSCTCETNRRPDIVNETFPEAQAEIRRVVESIETDAETANIKGLQAAHLNSDKFTKFGPRTFERQGVASLRQASLAQFRTLNLRSRT
jgi:hypothetical protein